MMASVVIHATMHFGLFESDEGICGNIAYGQEVDGLMEHGSSITLLCAIIEEFTVYNY